MSYNNTIVIPRSPPDANKKTINNWRQLMLTDKEEEILPDAVLEKIIMGDDLRLLVGLPPSIFKKILARYGERLTIVLPIKNEEKNLPHILPLIKVYAHQIIVVDGHSSDNSLEIVKDTIPNAKIIIQSERGKANALEEGLKAVNTSLVVTMDADGSHDPFEIPMFTLPLLFNYDFAKGSRFKSGGYSFDMTPFRLFGNTMFTLMTNFLYLKRFTDLCYGYNAFRTKAIQSIPISSNHFAIETEIVIKTVKKGFRIIEVPSVEYRRMHGNSNLSSFRDGWRILTTIMREFFL